MKQESETRRLHKKTEKGKNYDDNSNGTCSSSIMIAKAINVNNHIEMGK